MQIYLVNHPKYHTIPVTKKDKDTYKYVKMNIKHYDENLETYEVKNPKKLEQVDPLALKGTNDLMNLGKSCLQNIHATLRKNFYNQQYFTQISNTVLLAFNPNKEIEDLFNFEKIKKNKLIKANENQNNEAKFELYEPHIYKLAQMAVLKMKITNHSGIVLLGEKGSGKSFQCGQLIRYFSRESQSGTFGTQTAKIGEAPIERKTIDTNTLLDALGTALLENNQYSSRYGKFIKLFFIMDKKDQTKLMGANVQVFLLESTRVSHGESNFPIFSYLVSAQREIKNLHNIFKKVLEQREDQDIQDSDIQDSNITAIIQIIENLGLDKFGKYNYLKKIDKNQQQNAESFVTFIISLYNLSFDNKLIEELLISLASVLFIGNIFEKQISDKDEALLQFCQLSGIDSQKFFLSLTKSLSNMVYNQQQISGFKGALARYIYQVCFDSLIQQINKSLKPLEDEKNLKSISIFDTLGFEMKRDADGLQHNGFEQLMMNYAHEKILNRFLNHLKLEDLAYYKKQIQYESFNLTTNDTVIELFESNKLKNNRNNCQMGGILDQIQTNSQILREDRDKDKDLQLIIGNITHDKLSVKALLTRTVLRNDEENKLMQRSPKPWFLIQHSLGNVYYIVENFGDKNQETVNTSLIEILGKSKLRIISQKVNVQTLESSISLSQSRASNRLAKFSTSTLRSQLKTIEAQLDAIPLFYVVCFKSKSDSDNNVEFDDQQVLKQIKFNAIESVIQIQLQKYPIRMSHQEFIDKYNPELKSQDDICQFIQNNDSLTKTIIQVGNTDILMKPLSFLYLEQGGYKQDQQQLQQEDQKQNKQEQDFEKINQQLQEQINNLQIEKQIEIQKRISAQNDLHRLEEQVESLKTRSKLQNLVDNFIQQVQNLEQGSQNETPLKQPLQRDSISQISHLDQSFISEKNNNANPEQVYIKELDDLITAVSEYQKLYISEENNEEQLEQSKSKVRECYSMVEGYLKQYSIL